MHYKVIRIWNLTERFYGNASELTGEPGQKTRKYWGYHISNCGTRELRDTFHSGETATVGVSPSNQPAMSDAHHLQAWPIWDIRILRAKMSVSTSQNLAIQGLHST